MKTMWRSNVGIPAPVPSFLRKMPCKSNKIRRKFALLCGKMLYLRNKPRQYTEHPIPYMPLIRHLTIVFDTPIHRAEIPFLRGAVIASMPRDASLFHGHDGEGLRYAYPLIQYKSIQRKAALFSLGEGTEALWDYFRNCTPQVRLGNRRAVLTVEHIEAAETDVEVTETMESYRVEHWLPFNEDNFARYESEESLVARVQMLERILTGNILSMLKGLGIRTERQIELQIVAVERKGMERYKSVGLMSFDITFRCNVVMPAHIGLGRHVSTGFGTVSRLSR